MGRGFNIPWNGVQYTMGRGFDIPSIGSSIYHGKWVRHTIDRGENTIGRWFDISWLGG